jgi:hypothetical protein
VTTATMIHGVKSATAQQTDTASWLRLEAKDGSYIAVFMPIETARRMETAFAPDRADFDDGNITDVAAE